MRIFLSKLLDLRSQQQKKTKKKTSYPISKIESQKGISSLIYMQFDSPANPLASNGV